MPESQGFCILLRVENVPKEINTQESEKLTQKVKALLALAEDRVLSSAPISGSSQSSVTPDPGNLTMPLAATDTSIHRHRSVIIYWLVSY